MGSAVDLIKCGINSLPGGDERLLTSLLVRQDPVVIPVCRAALILFGGVADIGRPDQLLADERDEVPTEIAAVALFAEFHAVLPRTEILLSAGFSEWQLFGGSLKVSP